MATTLKQQRRRLFWLLWLALTVGLCSYFLYAVSSIEAGENALGGVFLPGTTTHGHHQIEMACQVCHTEPFGGTEVLQNACVQCHAQELEAVEDSHPRSKFTDPRNAETLSKLDARYCITCHREHRPELTHAMGVTLPDNLCFHCHADIGEERPTHRDFDFVSCGTSGCHNYHDNKALYENFLLKHSDKPMHLARQQLEERDLLSFLEITEQYPLDEYPLQSLDNEQMDAPQEFLISSTRHEDWFATSHANAGVNCSACHQVKDPDTAELSWQQKPDHKTCQACHQAETETFLQGKHGMRLAVGLSPMTPEQARLPMRPDAHGKQVNCLSCHGAHEFNTQRAASESCLQCHNDSHSRNYQNSPHAKLWEKEMAGLLPAGSGVSCASCHMPRVWHEDEEENERILVDHNQNNTLRPNDKMLRPVCLQCHGLQFSVDALADKNLIMKNFPGQPASSVESIRMAVEVEQLHEKKRQSE